MQNTFSDSSSFFAILRQRIKVSDVVRLKIKLNKKGSEYLGLCPIHNEKTPSFTVNDYKGFYHCFGCGAHGDVIKFKSETEGLSYKDAALQLGREYGVALPKAFGKNDNDFAKIYDILEAASNYFKLKLKNTQKALEYLTNRGVSEEAIIKYEIGYAPKLGLKDYLASKNFSLSLMKDAGLISYKEDEESEDNGYEVFRDRIIFPIKNAYSKIIGFGGRTIGENLPKYLNSPETLVFKKSYSLYGENLAFSHAYKQGNIIVTEGYIDVITMQLNGFPNTVATLGTAVTEQHLQSLWKVAPEIVMCFDGDSAGLKATEKAILLSLPYLNSTKKVSFVLLPKGYDPDSFIKEHGMLDIEKRYSLSEVIWHLETSVELKNINFESAETFAKLEQNLFNYTSKINDTILRKNVNAFFKDQLWNLRKSLRNPTNNYTSKKSKANSIPAASAFAEHEHLELSILSLIIYNLEILKHEEVLEYISVTEFHNTKLSEFKNWMLQDQYLQGRLLQKNTWNNISYLEYILNAGFIEIYNLILKYGIHNLKIEPLKTFELLVKKYSLALIKLEYIKLQEEQCELSYNKATLLHQEMQKINQEINELIEFRLIN